MKTGTSHVAVDGMGGDHGPKVVVAACARALKTNDQLHLLVVGQRDALAPELKRNHLVDHPRVTVIPATEVVEMDEEPARALRTKKDSSMRVAINCVADGRATAAVSAGNTGALMATARFVLKMIEGIDRPAIMSALPTANGRTQVLDLGANAECTAEHLVQFARMGSAACRVLTNKSDPTIGLLNIGSEVIKGNTVVKEAAQLLPEAGLNYFGFVEGDDIYKGTVDVVVCDGFSGNVMLKASEGLARLFVDDLKQLFRSSLYGKITAVLAAPVLLQLKRKLDPGQYNGASLMGLRGVVVKSHGSADAKSMANAIQIAAVEAQDNLPQRVAEELEKLT